MKARLIGLVGLILIIGCRLLGNVQVEACIDHPTYGRICAVVVDKRLFIKYDKSLSPAALEEIEKYAKDKLGLNLD